MILHQYATDLDGSPLTQEVRTVRRGAYFAGVIGHDACGGQNDPLERDTRVAWFTPDGTLRRSAWVRAQATEHLLP